FGRSPPWRRRGAVTGRRVERVERVGPKNLRRESWASGYAARMSLSYVKRASLALIALGLFALVTCSSDEPPPDLKAVAQGCIINTDCNSPLVCAFQRCHVECRDSSDCDPGQRCVVSDRPFHVCQLDQEKLCTYNSSCPDG